MSRPSPRYRRLKTDNKSLLKLRSESAIVDFIAHGNPPDHYLITFHGRGFYRPDGTNRVAIREEHQVSITLGASYPRLMPELQWKTPIFHPNISGSGVVCLGGYGTYWVPSLNLDELCEMLWDMIRYANYDVDSPYNRDAANWARLQQDFRLPIDHRPIRDRVAAGQVEAKVSKDQPASNNSKQTGTNTKPADEIMFFDDVVEAEVVDDVDSIVNRALGLGDRADAGGDSDGQDVLIIE